MAPGQGASLVPPCSNLRCTVGYWRKYLLHCWDISAPSQSFCAPIAIRHPGNCASIAPRRYAPGVDIKTLNVHEDLVSLYETGCTKSQAITKNIKDAICRLGLDLNGCRGQRCDGASNMWRRVSGVQAWTTSEYLKAIFYSLLLSFFELGILCSKEILMMRNALDTIQQ